MECWTVIHGGYNYSTPTWTEAEPCASLKEATDRFWRWVDDPHNLPDDSTEMMVFLYEPDEGGDNYPDFRIFQGPRGGIRRERV